MGNNTNNGSGNSNGKKSLMQALNPNTPITITLAAIIISGLITIYSLMYHIKSTMATEMAHLQNRITVVELKQKNQRTVTTDIKQQTRQDMLEIKRQLRELAQQVQQIQESIAYIKATLKRTNKQ